MRAKRFLAGAAAGVTALAVIGGCANQIKQLEPKLELRNAAQNLGAEKQAGFTLKLTGSADDLVAAVRKQDPDTSADDIDALKKLFNSSFTVAYDQGGDRAALSATVDGVTGTELRVVDQTLYLKAPVTELAKKFGGSQSDIDEMRDEFTTADPALKAFFNGEWVSLSVKDAAKTAGTTDSTKAAAEARKSAQNLVDGAQITRDKADNNHLIVTTSTTKAYSELKRLVTAVGGDETKSLSKELDKAPKDRPIVLDLWIDDDKLIAAEINLLQFIDGATGRVAVRVEVTTGAPIDVPAGATKIDPALVSSFAGATAGAGPDGVGATQVAQSLGLGAISLASASGGKPAAHLKEAASMFEGSPYQVKIVRFGVAEVTVGASKACLTVPASTAKKPKVTAGAC
jgi:hypothetical protein